MHGYSYRCSCEYVVISKTKCFVVEVTAHSRAPCGVFVAVTHSQDAHTTPLDSWFCFVRVMEIEVIILPAGAKGKFNEKAP